MKQVVGALKLKKKKTLILTSLYTGAHEPRGVGVCTEKIRMNRVPADTLYTQNFSRWSSQFSPLRWVLREESLLTGIPVSMPHSFLTLEPVEMTHPVLELKSIHSPSHFA